MAGDEGRSAEQSATSHCLNCMNVQNVSGLQRCYLMLMLIFSRDAFGHTLRRILFILINNITVYEFRTDVGNLDKSFRTIRTLQHLGRMISGSFIVLRQKPWRWL